MGLFLDYEQNNIIDSARNMTLYEVDLNPMSLIKNRCSTSNALERGCCICFLCLELRIAPRAASNYAMLNLKFTATQSSKFQVVYKFCKSDEIVQSDIAMQNDVVKNGIVKEYYKTLLQTLEKLSLQNKSPSGKLEILGGRYGSIGSSEVAVKVV